MIFNSKCWPDISTRDGNREFRTEKKRCFEPQLVPAMLKIKSHTHIIVFARHHGIGNPQDQVKNIVVCDTPSVPHHLKVV
jgi:hypothetical protein